MVNDNHFPGGDSAWEAHRPYVELLSQATNSCIAVMVRRGGYPFLSPNLDRFGYEVPATGSSDDPLYLEHRIHPDDLTIFCDLLTKLFDDYIASLPAAEQRDYKHIFEFRTLGKTGQWVRVISQLQILEFNAKGDPIMLGIFDLAPDQTSEGVRFTLMNFKTGEIVPFAALQQQNSLTPREIEILALVGEGKFSKEISDKLSISVHTVNRHRQNILEKMGANNAAEALSYARKMGLLV